MRFLTLALLLATLSAPAVAQKVEGQAHVQTEQRGAARVLVFGRDAAGNFQIPLQYQITYGQPEWKESHEEQVVALMKSDRTVRWRFGTNGWTTFDTNRALTVAGVKVPAGLYYCCIERNKDGKTYIVFLDPKTIHEQKLDAFQANAAKGGIKAPLKLEEGQDVVKKMAVAFLSSGDANKSTLQIAWGPRRMTAAIEVAGK